MPRLFSFTRATLARALQNLRPRAEDCIRPALERKLCEHLVQGKFLFNERNAMRRKSIFLQNFLFEKRFWEKILYEKNLYLKKTFK